MNLATEKAKSSAGLVGTAPPNSVNLEVKQSKGRIEITLWIQEVEFKKAQIKDARKRERIEIYRQYLWDLPTSPGFCPHFWFIILIWNKSLTVETIAGVNLA